MPRFLNLVIATAGGFSVMGVRILDESVTTTPVILLVIGTLLPGLAGCSFGPRVVGPIYRPIPVSQVTVFERPYLPPRDVVVARLDATGYGGYSGWRVDAIVLQRLCRQAARLGANGILLTPGPPPPFMPGPRYGSYPPMTAAPPTLSCGTPSTRYCYRMGDRPYKFNGATGPFQAVAIDLPRGVSSSAHWKTTLEKVRKYFPQCVPQKPRMVHARRP